MYCESYCLAPCRALAIDLTEFVIDVVEEIEEVCFPTVLKLLQDELSMPEEKLYEITHLCDQFRATAFISGYCVPILIENTFEENGRKKDFLGKRHLGDRKRLFPETNFTCLESQA